MDPEEAEYVDYMLATGERPLSGGGGCLLMLIVLALGLTDFLAADEPRKDRLHGYVGGPYKVVAADFTGDKLIDVLLGYRGIGVLAVDQGDGRGQLTPLAINEFSDADRKLNPDDASWSVPHVHNISSADLDGDGLLDLLFAVGGASKLKPGRVVVAHNAGRGQFKRVLEFSTPSEAKGVRFVDMDRDGRLDVMYTARGSGYKDDLAIGRLYIRRGLGNWKFGPAIESLAGKSAYSIDTADLNNDGFPDVVIPNEHDTSVTYFLNPGKTIFSRAASLSSRQVRASPIPNKRSHAINDVRVADFDGDGNQDLVTANLGTSTISVFPGNGDGTFGKDTLLDAGKNGAFLGIGDFDRDGDVDFVITHWTEDFASVFLNIGDGRFAARRDYRTGSGNYGVDVADLNGDGHLDIVTANYRALSMSLLIGAGDGTFKPAITRSKGFRSFLGKLSPHNR
ncbi:MAG: VCBS repeat-containing protein [Planctomycetaceae bacterium]|nr:VCBS repeat-containing protein [Planctomycetaceae bacterium]